jgi:two-component system cell cycle response regulator DivK
LPRFVWGIRHARSTFRKEKAAMTKILCVEDSEDNLFTLHKRLSLAGFEVKVATNGTEGVDWAKTLRPHLIVMDLRLPGLDGWEATRRLKGQPETKHIPIIVVTSDTSEKSREKAFAAGCDEFETKPVNFEKLVGKIHSLLSRGAKA